MTDVDEDAPGTLILTDEPGRSLTWHHSVEFDGSVHSTACDRVVDCDQIRDVLLDPVESWHTEVTPASGCADCHDSIQALEEGLDKGTGVETDGGQDIPRLEAAEGEISTGSIVVDLASGKALQVVGKSAQTVGEHRQTRSDATAEMFGADRDETVFECVFLPDGEKLSPPTKTYAYPESRLLRYPVENATEHAGGIQMWLRSAFIDELAEGVVDDLSFDRQFREELRALLADVYSPDLATTFEVLVDAKRQDGESR